MYNRQQSTDLDSPVILVVKNTADVSRIVNSRLQVGEHIVKSSRVSQHPDHDARVSNSLGATQLTGEKQRNLPLNISSPTFHGHLPGISSMHPLAEMQRDTQDLPKQPQKKGCCRMVGDFLLAFIQGIFYCVIFPALVMVGPAGLGYFLLQCFVENDVSTNFILH